MKTASNSQDTADKVMSNTSPHNSHKEFCQVGNFKSRVLTQVFDQD